MDPENEPAAHRLTAICIPEPLLNLILKIRFLFRILHLIFMLRLTECQYTQKDMRQENQPRCEAAGFIECLCRIHRKPDVQIKADDHFNGENCVSYPYAAKVGVFLNQFGNDFICDGESEASPEQRYAVNRLTFAIAAIDRYKQLPTLIARFLQENPPDDDRIRRNYKTYNYGNK